MTVIPYLKVGQTKVKFLVESTRTAQRRVDVIKTVGGADNEDLAAVGNAVHQRQQSSDEGDVLVTLARHAAALWRQAVDLVDENNARLQ